MNVDPLASTAVASPQAPTPIDSTTSTEQPPSTLVEARPQGDIAEGAIRPSIAAADDEEKADVPEGPQTANAVAPGDPPLQLPAILDSQQRRAKETAVRNLIFIMAWSAVQVRSAAVIA